MEVKHQSISLDFNDFNTPCILAHQGDNKTRFIDITINDFSFGLNHKAIIKASINGITKAINPCEIKADENLVTVELTDTMLDTSGTLYCELSVIENDEIITTQHFIVNVIRSIISDKDITESSEYGFLTKLIEENAKICEDAKVIKNITDDFKNVSDVNEILNEVESLSQEIPDIKDSVNTLNSNKAEKTDLPIIASENKAGLIRPQNGMMIDKNNDGATWCQQYSIDIYNNASNYTFISKGTLKNVLAPQNEYFAMLIPALVREKSGENIINLPDTARNSLIKIYADSPTVKNKNIAEYNNNLFSKNCSYFADEDSYIITANGTSPYIGEVTSNGGIYRDIRGTLYPYCKCVVSIISDNTVFNMNFITYFDENRNSLGYERMTSSGTFIVDGTKEGAKYFTIRIGTSRESEIMNIPTEVRVQIEAGNTKTAYTSPETKPLGDKTAFDETTNILANGSITVQYVPKII